MKATTHCLSNFEASPLSGSRKTGKILFHQNTPKYHGSAMLINMPIMNRFVLALLLLLGQTTNATRPPSSAANSIGEWEEDIGFYQSLRVTADSPIFKQTSKHQQIEVHVSEYYGKILVLDGVVQLTERDADSYNEMMAQIPMMQHKNPKRVLVIGGGDGYILSEVCVLSRGGAGRLFCSTLPFVSITHTCILFCSAAASPLYTTDTQTLKFGTCGSR